MDKLLADGRASPTPQSSLIADHLLVRDAILGKDMPLVLAATPVPLRNYLAYLANELPWERARALAALDRITGRNIRDTSGLVNRVEGRKLGEFVGSDVRSWVRPPWRDLPERWEIEEPAATTSYLAALEYKARVSVSELNRAYCNNVVCRRAALLQIALAMYRLDHKEYPPRLANLVPEYLAELPLDPYSSQPFEFERAGLELPLEERSGAANFQRIEAHTPFFWSVGAGDFRLVQQSHSQSQPGEESDPDHPRQQVAVSTYVFFSEEWPWDGDVFAFPLPE